MTGTYIVRLGHSIVHSTFGGNMGYEYSAAEHMASFV